MLNLIGLLLQQHIKILLESRLPAHGHDPSGTVYGHKYWNA